MAKGPTYRVPFRRRKEGKTDYKARRAFIRSGLPRLVIRKTLNNTIVQVVEAQVEGDRVIASASSSELKKRFSWRGNCGNLPSSYLTGLLCGKKASSKGKTHLVLDIGLHFPSRGARVFAALKGVLDAGIQVPYSEEVLPDEERIRGAHIAEYAKFLSSDPERYNRTFSRYLLRGLRPEDIVDEFTGVKQKIDSLLRSVEKSEQ